MVKCVVLRTSTMFANEHRLLLRKILLGGPDLFAVVGEDCEAREEAMDGLCLELDISGERPEAFCNTTSHPRESLEELIALAKQWCQLRGWSEDVQVIEI